RAHFAERFEGINRAGAFNGDSGLVQIDRDHVTGFEPVAEALGQFARINLAGGDTVAEENAGETFRQYHLAAGGAEGNGRMLPRTAAAEIAAGHHDGVIAVERAGLDEPGWVK